MNTPAPWKVESLENNHHKYQDWPTFTVRDGKTNACLAVVGDVDRQTAPMNAGNAQIMAAAPELLAALELCYTRIFNFGMDSLRDPQMTQKLCNEAMDAAQAALKKAGVFSIE